MKTLLTVLPATYRVTSLLTGAGRTWLVENATTGAQIVSGQPNKDTAERRALSLLNYDDAAKLIDQARPGDTLTITTPQGQQRRGRVVMKCAAGGWVLNGGGKHGTPLIADASNTVALRKGKA